MSIEKINGEMLIPKYVCTYLPETEFICEIYIDHSSSDESLP